MVVSGVSDPPSPILMMGYDTCHYQRQQQKHFLKISNNLVLVQVNSQPQNVCKCLSHNHWLALSVVSDNSCKAPLCDLLQKPKSNGSVGVDLATKPLIPISAGLVNLGALLPATSSAYFCLFLSNASSIVSSE